MLYINIMGRQNDMVWILELFSNTEKSQLLKTYTFATIPEVAYVLNMKPSMVYNYYHNLINARGKLQYVTIHKKQILL
jgi:hypothetical protein